MSLIQINVVNYLRSPNQLFLFLYFWDIHTLFVETKKKISFQKFSFLQDQQTFSRIFFFFFFFRHAGAIFFFVMLAFFSYYVLFYELNCYEVDRNMKKRQSQKIELTKIIRINDIV